MELSFDENEAKVVQIIVNGVVSLAGLCIALSCAIRYSYKYPFRVYNTKVGRIRVNTEDDAVV
jgi:hypothetical protein